MKIHCSSALGQRSKKDILVNCIAVFIVFCGTFALIYNYVLNSANSDYYFHFKFAMDLPLLRDITLVEFQTTVMNGKILSYPVWHILSLITYQIVYLFENNTELAGIITLSIVTALFEVLAFYAVKYVLKYFIEDKRKQLLFDVMTYVLLIMGPLYIPLINTKYYLGQITANTWHNPTTIAVKGVSILCFLLYTVIFTKECTDLKEKSDIKIIAAAGLLLAFSALCKPSFYQMFVPGLAFACLIELIKSKGKQFPFCMKMFLSVIPVLFIAVIQMKLSFEEQGNGLGFSFWYVIKQYTNHPLGSLIISIPFALYVFFLAHKTLFSDKMLLISGCAFLSGTMQYWLLYQTQDAMAGNFGWGAFLGVNLLNIASVIKFVNLNRVLAKKHVWIGWSLLGAQVFFGFLYVINTICKGVY